MAYFVAHFTVRNHAFSAHSHASNVAQTPMEFTLVHIPAHPCALARIKLTL